MKQLLHTPEGVRDIYHEECAKKLALQNRLHKTLHLYGYHDIQTPMYEYFDVFRKEIGTIPSRELYKFFDRDGNTLVLRPDITPQIARATATLFKDDDAEMLALVIDCLKNAGLEEFQISIGNVDFFQSLIEESEIDDETEERLRELINNRNFFGAD